MYRRMGASGPSSSSSIGSSGRGSKQRMRPSSAMVAGRQGRAAVRDSKMMLSGLSMGNASKFAGSQRSQSSFAARLQQSIVQGRRSQRSIGLL